MRKTTKMAVILAAMSVMVLGAATMVSADEKNGWAKEGSDWYYYIEDEKIVNGWAQDGEGLWYFLGDEGKMLKNKFVNGTDSVVVSAPNADDSAYYYVDGSGVMVTGWKKMTNETFKNTPYADEKSNGWYYFGTDGKMYQNAWIKGATAWYAVNASGKMFVDSVVRGDIAAEDGKEYYTNKDGAMVTGWFKTTDDSSIGGAKGNWIYAKDSGELVKNAWAKVNGTWYYFGAVSQTALDDNNVFSVSKSAEDGYQMVSNAKFLVDGKEFFANSSGAMATGWKTFTDKTDKTNTVTYLFGNDGVMKKGKVDSEVIKVNVNGASVYALFAQDGTAYKANYAVRTAIAAGDTPETYVYSADKPEAGATEVVYYRLGSAANKVTLAAK